MPPEQGLDPARRLFQLALVVAGLLAPVRSATLSAIMSGLAHSIIGPGWRANAGDAVRLSGEMIALEADGIRYVVNTAAIEPGRPARRRVRFLAPFDPLVWDRPRFEHLWGWPYRFEAYVPRRGAGWGTTPCRCRGARR